MTTRKAIVTGATGLLGRHLVTEVLADGWNVTAVVRKTSNIDELKSRGVTLLTCDLSTDALEPAIFTGADAVFHAAAAVIDWAPWSFFEANTIRPTELICDAMTK